MQSFRTELEESTERQKLVEKDIIELAEKIRLFREGKTDPEKFRSLRLARGVYGQRQPGVQMIRIKLPCGKISAAQLLRIAAVSDEYSNGKLHFTTRQDIQIHFVSLDRTPELWAELEKDEITLREACGNTVRNITASPTAGIDVNEPFDVTPYAEAAFRYFLRHPVGQDLGRKFKIAFSATEDDSALTFIHDLGFIPRVEIIDGKPQRGFKVLIGGGLGAQPFTAQTAYEFLPADQIIPFTEALIRVFDRHGERSSRHKARIKYLLAKTGLSELLRLAEEEKLALREKIFPVAEPSVFAPKKKETSYTTFRVSDDAGYLAWRGTNVITQKQPGWFAVKLRVPLGNISSETARNLAAIISTYSYDDARITIEQDLLLRFIPAEALPALYSALLPLGLALPGAESTADITSCPGTDTCNLGISNSTAATLALEEIIREEFPQLIFENDIKIKISGCMNSCGQHGLAQIGFHGSSFKSGAHVVPALQLLLGGGAMGSGEGRIAEKVIKFPSKRAQAVLRALLNDFADHKNEPENFNAYYDRRGKNYFYSLLKPFADNTSITEEELRDWGQEIPFETAIGTGECAGVVVDLVQTLVYEAEEKYSWAESALNENRFADSIYHSYSVFVSTAKAYLLAENISCNTQAGILRDFDQHVVVKGLISFGEKSFSEYVLRIREHAPSADFAKTYLADAGKFLHSVQQLRQTEITS